MGGHSVDVTKNIYSRGTINLEGDPPNEKPESAETTVDTATKNRESFQSEKIEQALLTDTREQTHLYFGYIEKDKSLYGVCVVFEPDVHPLTEKEVEQIFKSVELVDQE